MSRLLGPLRGRVGVGVCLGVLCLSLMAGSGQPATAQSLRQAKLHLPAGAPYGIEDVLLPPRADEEYGAEESSSASPAHLLAQEASQTSSASGYHATSPDPNETTPDLWTFLRHHRWIRESSETRRFNYSARAGFSLPQNDLRNTTGDSPNFLVGAHAERLFHGVNQFRTVGEYWFFRQGHQQFGNGAQAQQLDTKVRTLALGGQYLYRIGGADKRFSIGGGLYLMRWSVASVNTLTFSVGTAQASGTSHWYHVGESLDATYRLSHRLELDGRWAHSHYGYENIPVNVAQLGAAFRF